jgi:surface carbohydrate biosynthesis protein (TIGR04326 family)
MHLERSSGVSMTLWDAAGDPPGNGIVYRWDGHREDHGCRSLLRYVERHAERLRRDYLAFIHDLGEATVQGRRVIDHLAFDDGFSYWWMTSLTEHSPWKSPAIVDALRALAVEDILTAERPSQLRLVSRNRALTDVLQQLCEAMAIRFVAEKPAVRARGVSVRGLYEALPAAARAAITLLRHLRLTWPLKQTAPPAWFAGVDAMFLGSYFIHLNAERCARGEFASGHWGRLTRLFSHWRRQTNWLHHFLQSEAVPTTAVALRWVRGFNHRRETEGVHAFVDAYVGLGMVARVVRRWLNLQRRTAAVRDLGGHGRPAGRRVTLWPLIRPDWIASMRGQLSVLNLLWIEQFDCALGAMPAQRKGLYLYENQGWERALIRAWRLHGHGELIGVAHSTLRFWDLRYYTDPRTRASHGPHALPQPDRIAVNGPEAVCALRAFDPGIPLTECEAVRYEHLRDVGARARPDRRGGDAIRVLVLGDFDRPAAEQMLQLLSAAVARIDAHVECGYKPHPNCAIEPRRYPDLALAVVDRPLAEVLRDDWDVAYTSNTTSASIDAWLSGLPVAIVLDDRTLNFSPLRDAAGVRFVAGAGELSSALIELPALPVDAVPAHRFFHLDPDLPRWRQLVS